MLNAIENSHFIQIDAQLNAYQKTLQDIRQTYFARWLALEFNPDQLKENIKAVFVLDFMVDRNQNIINYLECVKKHRKAINDVEQLFNELDTNNFSNIAEFIEAIDQKLMTEGVEIINSILREKQSVNRYIERYVYAYKVLSVLLIIIGCLLLATSASSSFLILNVALSMLCSGGFLAAIEKVIIYIFERYMGKTPESTLHDLRVATNDVNKYGRNVYLENENQEWEFLLSEVPQTYKFSRSYFYQERRTLSNIGIDESERETSSKIEPGFSATGCVSLTTKGRSDILLNSFFNRNSSILGSTYNLVEEVVLAYSSR